MKLLVTTFAVLVGLFVQISCYSVPPVTVTAYDDNRYNFHLEHEDGISQVTFHVNVNKPIDTVSEAEYSTTLLAPIGGAWSDVFGYTSEPINKGEVLNYIVSVTKDGVVYNSEPASFEVKEILPKLSRSIVIGWYRNPTP